MEAEIGAFCKKGAAAKGFILQQPLRNVWVSGNLGRDFRTRKKEKDGKENKKAQTRTTPAPREQRQGDPYCWILSTPVYQRNLKDT